MAENVSDSKAMPPLVPLMPFEPGTSESMVIASELLGVIS